MIIDLPNTSTGAIAKKLVQLRNDVGAMTLGRVLTLVVVVDDQSADDVIEVATEASRQHPSRIVVLVLGDKRGANRLDGQIRLGGDAGASEVVVLRLYGRLAGHGDSVVVPLLLPDSPVVAWWPRQAPADLRTDPIAALASRRITDSAEAPRPGAFLKRLAQSYRAGDTDLAWTRITLWRGLLAAALDGPPYEQVTSAVVAGAPDSPSTDLLAGWLAWALRVPVTRVRTPHGSGIRSVRLERPGGPIDLVRPGDYVATMTQPGQPDRRISLRRRRDAECLADELRRLDEDDTYADVLRKGLPELKTQRAAGSAAAPSVSEARRRAERLRRNRSAQLAAAMITAPPPPKTASEAAVKKAAATKLAGKKTAREKVVAKRSAPASVAAATSRAEATPRAKRAAKAARTESTS
ncbi:MAG TPA: glucose-6-phosphate dehydrogenase assembly protein OpcA [Dermatophilaceae bacterium]|nr:glucose-6-phosphate dehydrogenase assembly protein OpcA [Dermatophilaceae bacterium]